MTFPAVPAGSGPRPACWQIGLPVGGEDLGAAGGVAGRPAQDVGDVPAGVVVGEQCRLDVAGGAVGFEECGGGGDGVAGVVDVGDPVVVAVDAVPAGPLGCRVDGGAAPGVPGQAADAELHRPGRPGGVRAGMHSGRVRAALVGFGFADAGQDGPGDAVLGSGFLVVGEVGGGDRSRRGAGGRLGLAGGSGLAEYPGSGAEERCGQQHQRGGCRDGDLDAAGVRARAHQRRLLRCSRRRRARRPRPPGRRQPGPR